MEFMYLAFKLLAGQVGITVGELGLCFCALCDVFRALIERMWRQQVRLREGENVKILFISFSADGFSSLNPNLSPRCKIKQHSIDLSAAPILTLAREKKTPPNFH